jgi:hypothetical protein
LGSACKRKTGSGDCGGIRRHVTAEQEAFLPTTTTHTHTHTNMEDEDVAEVCRVDDVEAERPTTRTRGVKGADVGQSCCSSDDGFDALVLQDASELDKLASDALAQRARQEAAADEFLATVDVDALVAHHRSSQHSSQSVPESARQREVQERLIQQRGQEPLNRHCAEGTASRDRSGVYVLEVKHGGY